MGEAGRPDVLSVLSSNPFLTAVALQMRTVLDLPAMTLVWSVLPVEVSWASTRWCNNADRCIRYWVAWKLSKTMFRSRWDNDV